MIDNTNVSDHTVAVYARHEQAEAGIKILNESGYNLTNLSIVGKNYETEEHPLGFVNTGDRMLSWGKFGVFWGSIWGLLFGSAMLVVPGIGPVMFAGWFVAMLQGALLGGGLAALGGALASIGIPKNTVVEYEAALKAGCFLLMAHGDAAQIKRAKDLLYNTNAIRIDSYSTPQLAKVSRK